MCLDVIKEKKGRQPKYVYKAFFRISIKTEIIRFIGDDPTPEFWGYYADYDWVVFCQLFGRMIDLPKGFPMYCNDIKQLAVMLGNPMLPEQDSTEHHALHDARWNKLAFDFLRLVAENCNHKIVTSIFF